MLRELTYLKKVEDMPWELSYIWSLGITNTCHKNRMFKDGLSYDLQKHKLWQEAKQFGVGIIFSSVHSIFPKAFITLYSLPKVHGNNVQNTHLKIKWLKKTYRIEIYVLEAIKNGPFIFYRTLTISQIFNFLGSNTLLVRLGYWDQSSYPRACLIG